MLTYKHEGLVLVIHFITKGKKISNYTREINSYAIYYTNPHSNWLGKQEEPNFVSSCKKKKKNLSPSWYTSEGKMATE